MFNKKVVIVMLSNTITTTSNHLMLIGYITTKVRIRIQCMDSFGLCVGTLHTGLPNKFMDTREVLGIYVLCRFRSLLPLIIFIIYIYIHTPSLTFKNECWHLIHMPAKQIYGHERGIRYICLR